MDKCYEPIGLALIMLGIFLFGMGFHNVDLSYNMSNASQCLDTNGFGFVQDKFTMYVNGLTSLIFAQIFEIVGLVMVVTSKKN